MSRYSLLVKLRKEMWERLRTIDRDCWSLWLQKVPMMWMLILDLRLKCLLRKCKPRETRHLTIMIWNNWMSQVMILLMIVRMKEILKTIRTDFFKIENIRETFMSSLKMKAINLTSLIQELWMFSVSMTTCSTWMTELLFNLQLKINCTTL